MRVLINIKGTAAVSVCLCWLYIPPLQGMRGAETMVKYVRLMSVRTEETRLINRAFMLASSPGRPKPGSADAVQPTAIWVSRMFYRMSCVPPRTCRCARIVGGWRGLINVLRARKRSSERIAMALTRSTATARVSEQIYHVTRDVIPVNSPPSPKKNIWKTVAGSSCCVVHYRM